MTIWNIFLLFPENELWHIRQIVFPKPDFWKKIRKIFPNVLCWNFYPACRGLRQNVIINSFLHKWRLLSSADNLCKQFGPRSGKTKCRAWSRSKLLDTQMVFLKDFFEKNPQTTKNMQNYPTRKGLSANVFCLQLQTPLHRQIHDKCMLQSKLS